MAGGVTMSEGSVPNTCQSAGLEAVCAGEGCQWRSSRCKDVPLSVNGPLCACSYLNPISDLICGKGTKAVNCHLLNRVFASISNWQSNEWSIVDGKSCEAGWKYTSSSSFQLYAYCFKKCELH